MPPTRSDVVIQSVSFDPTGVQVTYFVPAQDRKANEVLHVHTLVVPLGDDYDDEIEALMKAAQHLALDVAEDLPRLAPMRADKGEVHAERYGS